MDHGCTSTSIQAVLSGTKSCPIEAKCALAHCLDTMVAEELVEQELARSFLVEQVVERSVSEEEEEEEYADGWSVSEEEEDEEEEYEEESVDNEELEPEPEFDHGDTK